MGAIFGLIIPVAGVTIRHSFEDSSKYYQFKSMVGPFSVTTKDGVQDLGPAATSFLPGESIGYIITECLDLKIKITGTNQLVEAATGYIINTTSGEVSNDPARRNCGPHKIFRYLPVDLQPGYYELHRSLVFFPTNWAPSTGSYPPLVIKVVKKP